MRHTRIQLTVSVLALGCSDPSPPDRDDPADITSQLSASAVNVAPPTGIAASDVASIEAAIAAAGEGDVIRFARGTYQIEEGTRFVISQPGVTLLGHGSGTWIKGPLHIFSPFALDGHFHFNGGNQSVRWLNFDGFATALSFGEFPGPGVVRTGGYGVENSTFLNGDLPLEYRGNSDEVSVFKGNRFIDVTIPFLFVGRTVHYLENTNLNPNPENASAFRPFNAGIMFPGANVCENNVLEGNTTVANADGFIIFDCSSTVIRRNKFMDQVLLPGDDEFATFDNGSAIAAFGPGFQNNLIEHNELNGSQGIGLILTEGSGNRIVKNKFTNLVAGDIPPFEGALLGLHLGGTAILFGEPTTDNRACENKFKDVDQPVVDFGSANILCGTEAGGSSLLAKGLLSAAARLSVRENPKLRLLRERLSLRPR